MSIVIDDRTQQTQQPKPKQPIIYDLAKILAVAAFAGVIGAEVNIPLIKFPATLIFYVTLVYLGYFLGQHYQFRKPIATPAPQQTGYITEYIN